MSDETAARADIPAAPRPRLPRIGRVWLAILAIPAALLLLDPDAVRPVLAYAWGSLSQTAIFIVIACAALAYVKATSAEALLARAFEGREARMILLAALAGGLSPFCSCEVIPFIAAMLAVGAPLSAAMAFWLSSPLMDPAMFAITAAELGLGFAVFKAAAAVGIGLVGGATVMAFAATPAFADPLRGEHRPKGCCRSRKPTLADERPVWAFWRSPDRRATFRDEALTNFLFLLKWMTLAYLISALMVRYVPADWIGGILGGSGVLPVVLGALVGMPAYLNGYAAVPLVGGLLDQGLAPGAAMSFVIAGGISCIPAALAVWPLVKPRVFAAYAGFGLGGAVAAGLLWNAVAL